MTLRHPERLSSEGESDSDPSATGVNLESNVRDAPGGLSRTGVESVASPQRKQPVCEHPPIVHPFTTDFGPKTLTRYLRSECQRLELSAVLDKGKGREADSTNLNPSYHGHTSCERHHIPYTDVEYEVDGDVSSYDKSVIFGTPLDDPTHEGLSQVSDQCTGQSSTDETRTLPTTGLSDITNLQSTFNESDPLQPAASYTGTRRPQRLVRKELGTREAPSGENVPSLIRPSSKQTTSTKPSRGRSQPAITPPDTDSRRRPSRAQSASHSSQPADHTSQLPRSGLSRRTNFEEHTKTKRQVVRAITARAPQTLEGSIGQPRKKARQFTAAEQFSVPSSSADNTHSSLVFAPASPSEKSKSRLLESGHAALQTIQCETPESSKQPMISPGSSLPQETFINGISTLKDDKSCNSQGRIHDSCGEPLVDENLPPAFDYAAVVPECIPESEKQKFLDTARRRTSNSSTDSDSDSERYIPVPDLDRRPRREQDGAGKGKTPCKCSHTYYPRVWLASEPQSTLDSGPGSVGRTLPRPRITAVTGTTAASPSISLEDFDTNLWMDIATYLSTQDLKRLRLVSHKLAGVLDKLLFHNVVVNFGQSFFDVTGGSYDGEAGWSPSKSMFQEYGSNINQFGVSFEYDLAGLSSAKPKVIEEEQTAWFGTFTWPTKQYPRFPALQSVEDLVDHNRPLLKEAFKHITKASELGLCIDSGHGWLEGPDVSDLALFSRRLGNGSKVFGKTFATEDVWTTFARGEYFRWAQQNTINETTKHLLEHRTPEQGSTVREMNFLNSVQIRDMESFRAQEQQPDYDPDCHIGGPAGTTEQHALNFPLILVGRWMQANTVAAGRVGRAAGRRGVSPRRQAQWPLIFSGHNVAAEVGGHCTFVQTLLSHPMNSPLLPGHLTEAQAQWLLETVWAQRAFLSAYTTAIITNKQNFRRIHTVRISKLSSGLLPSLEQGEFWGSLPGLKQLQILISPDWRQEHCIGDRSHSRNMSISPAKAAQMFTRFLRLYVVKMEHLHSLTIGYVGGGEHAVGMCARNQHVLPAPIVHDPKPWLHEKMDGKELLDLTKFDHIRDLKFENCWFSPWMLQEFMKRSWDTSLHSLILDSVSMIPFHDPTLEHALTTAGDNLRCQYDPWNWHRESLPTSAAWCRVLECITPGTTPAERKHEAGCHRTGSPPLPKRTFRGHNQKIIFNSCGYVKISLPKKLHRGYKQNAAVCHLFSPLDSGLRARKERFSMQVPPANSDPETPVTGLRVRHPRSSETDSWNRVMMNKYSSDSEDHPWLGNLTQCIHPIEKRVLEEGWGMTFGWPNNLDRWAAVEDGFYEGGTGRFSGVVEKDHFPTDGEDGESWSQTAS
ncbi:hypothetical protein A1O3_04139 [Capronia epimyces CBS 606.96]|uniref:F-box domain-containing protein n=1 Tax=Capronia epimyces CBS 606.96 TaxID=1182542 RepID=W9YBX5_9EURO|nr:uncharacterized protein A1O3_04139 [Capronia epimyces CBS 606.96]EXJ87180.1 hypothetical protein A1O3_04139 [Capronia epimyces CBS 606.96]